jgi:3-oxoacyl-[acyl-carrier-protein] synthase III
MTEVYIQSVAHYLPAGRLTNEEVLLRLRQANEHRLGKDDLDLLLYGTGRKFDFLGIETRSVCEESDNTVSMATTACRQALCKADLPESCIDCLIATGVSNPFREPSLANVVARQLGVESSDFFDVNDTCNGFLKATDVACQYLRTGRYRNVLLVSSENPYETAAGLGIDYALESMSDADHRFSTLTVGCGAAAMVLGVDGEGRRIVNYREKRETVHWNASVFTVPGIFLPGPGHGQRSPGVWTDARLVAAQIIKEIPGFILDTLSQWGLGLDEVGLFVMHQLGNNVTYATLELLGVDRSKAPVNTFHECGNMASANLPINLSIAEERGHVGRGHQVLLVSSSCGLSYSILRLKY